MGSLAALVLFGTAPWIALDAGELSVRQGPEITLTIRADRAGCEAAPTQLPPAFVAITLVNDAMDSHEVQVSGPTSLGTPEPSPISTPSAGALYLGGPAAVGPGGVQTVVLAMRTVGTYVLACGVSAEPGRVRTTSVRVVGDRPSSNREPQGQAVIELGTGCDFSVPPEVGGRDMWEIGNAGDEPQDLRILSLQRGPTIQEIVASLDENNGIAPKGTEAGGMRALSPGVRAWLQLDLPPGDYAAVCSVGAPDVESGTPQDATDTEIQQQLDRPVRVHRLFTVLG